MYIDTARLLNHLRDAACLAHSAPGVSVRISDSSHDHMFVSASCLGAPLDPCRFRALVIAATSGRLAVLGRLTSVEVTGGLVHLGGGLFQPSHPGGSSDRWFVSTLEHERISELARSCPLASAPSDALSVVVKPDRDLARCAVRLRCETRTGAADLDEVAMRLLATCLVDELITSNHPCQVSEVMARRRPNRHRRPPDVE